MNAIMRSTKYPTGLWLNPPCKQRAKPIAITNRTVVLRANQLPKLLCSIDRGMPTQPSME